MRHYFSVYKTLAKLNFAALAAYRMNFINSLISGVIWGFFTISTMLLLTSGSRSINGWNRTELLILTGSHSIIMGIFHTLFTRNFERFSQIIHHGQLDSLLLKPMDSQFLMSLWIVNYVNITRTIIGFLFTIYIAIGAKYAISIQIVISYLILMLIGLLLLYSVWFIISTLIIWATSLSNLTNLLYNISAINRFPTEMYRGLPEFVLLFMVPITLIITVPTKTILHRALFGDVFQLVVCALVLFSFSRFFWKFALRSYTSASG
jgi:ABC-2 type transport system permease protein